MRLRQLSSWSSWSSLWGRSQFIESQPVPDPGLQVHALRVAMRDLVMELPGPSGPRLLGAIERCPDVRTLWYLRSPLMQALATGRGELGAREALAELDGLFRQGWPEAPVSRSARLG
jgi:hypothetical protein